MQSSQTAAVSRGLRVGLWGAQIVAGGLFSLFGLMKLTRPIAELAQTMHWAAEFPETMVRLIGALDLAGGLGMILPAATRVAPRLTVWAALGCMLLQVCAIIFHLSRGEAAVLPLNGVLLALSGFVLWGRAKRALIAPRA